MMPPQKDNTCCIVGTIFGIIGGIALIVILLWQCGFIFTADEGHLAKTIKSSKTVEARLLEQKIRADPDRSSGGKVIDWKKAHDMGLRTGISHKFKGDEKKDSYIKPDEPGWKEKYQPATLKKGAFVFKVADLAAGDTSAPMIIERKDGKPNPDGDDRTGGKKFWYCQYPNRTEKFFIADMIKVDPVAEKKFKEQVLANTGAGYDHGWKF